MMEKSKNNKKQNNIDTASLSPASSNPAPYRQQLRPTYLTLPLHFFVFTTPSPLLSPLLPLSSHLCLIKIPRNLLPTPQSPPPPPPVDSPQPPSALPPPLPPSLPPLQHTMAPDDFLIFLILIFLFLFFICLLLIGLTVFLFDFVLPIGLLHLHPLCSSSNSGPDINKVSEHTTDLRRTGGTHLIIDKGASASFSVEDAPLQDSVARKSRQSTQITHARKKQNGNIGWY